MTSTTKPTQSDLDETVRWIRAQESAISGPTLPSSVERVAGWLATVKGLKPKPRMVQR
jgi:hypothetical protein